MIGIGSGIHFHPHKTARSAVKLDRLRSFFSTSPSAKLLRSPHAAHIAYFLYLQFKDSGSITSPHSRLLGQLSEFLENVHETDADILVDRPETYLTQWSSGDSRWLRRFSDATHSEAVYELTPHSEDVLKFLSESLDHNLGFVGTESRLKRIIETLSDIVVRGSADRSRRLDHLRAERDRLDREISDIESGAAVSTYSSTAIRERFAEAVSDLASLQGDFRAVEDCFKAITRNVQKKQSELDGSRGEILGFALAAEDSLKQQDQGVSFDEFVRLILSPSKQDQLETIVSRLDEIEVLAEQVEGMRRIRGMIGSLSDEAEKVLRTTRRLSSTLRRLLDSRVQSTRLRLAAVLREIRGAAARLAENPPRESIGIEILNELDLLNVSERTFWTAPARFEAPALTQHQPDADDRQAAFRHFAALQRLDWDAMKRNIADMLRAAPRLPLPELLAAHPPQGGAVEVLAYVQIAHDDGHQIDERVTQTIRLPRSDSILAELTLGVSPFSDSAPAERDMLFADEFEVPSVVFLNSRLRSLIQGLEVGDEP